MNVGTLLERAYRRMGAEIVSGTLTGGTTLTLVDSSIANAYVANKFNKTWGAFITSTTDAAAPVNQFQPCSAYARATGTVTVSSAFTAAPGAGDKYSLIKLPVKLPEMVHLASEALSNFGFGFTREDSSLSVATGTLLYNLPAAIAGAPILRVYLRDADNNIVSAPYYQIVSAAPGGTRKLYFTTQPEESTTIIINYQVEHPDLDAYSDTVDENIPDALAVQALVVEGFRSIAFPRQRKRDVDNYNAAAAELDAVTVRLRKPAPTIEARGLSIGMYN